MPIWMLPIELLPITIAMVSVLYPTPENCNSYNPESMLAILNFPKSSLTSFLAVRNRVIEIPFNGTPFTLSFTIPSIENV
jgi:hypothetical protein